MTDSSNNSLNKAYLSHGVMPHMWQKCFMLRIGLKRFKKCIGSGLKPSWVLDKTERKRRREKKKKTVPQQQHQQQQQQQQQTNTSVMPFVNPAKRCSQGLNHKTFLRYR